MTIHASSSFYSLAISALRRYPDRVAFKWVGGQLTYSQTLLLIGQLQAAIQARGITRGARVALLGTNRADMWCAGLALQGLGAASTWLHPKGALDAQCFQLEDAGVSAVIVDAEHFGDRCAAFHERLPELQVITLGAAESSADLLSGRPWRDATPIDRSNALEMATLSYTGGTTGRQKGVVKTGAANAYAALQILSCFDLPLMPRFLAVAPISHVTGTNVVPTLLRGGTVHLMANFDIEEMAAIIERERINVTMMVPTMVYGLLEHPLFNTFDLSSLECLLYAGSPISSSRLVEAISQLGPIFCQLYGQTECSPIASLRTMDHDLDQPTRLDACGFSVPGCEVRLLDDHNQEVGPGEAGEICVRSPAVMTEYWRQTALTQEAMAGGWLHTGDVGRFDETGYLYIVDRKKDMIVSGGFNVYPREVEDALESHPAVSVAAVIGVPDPKWGETVIAYVVLRLGETGCVEDLIRHVKVLKGSVNAPKIVEIVDSLPLTAIGKLDKKKLRSKHWEGQTRNVS